MGAIAFEIKPGKSILKFLFIVGLKELAEFDIERALIFHWEEVKRKRDVAIFQKFPNIFCSY